MSFSMDSQGNVAVDTSTFYGNWHHNFPSAFAKPIDPFSENMEVTISTTDPFYGGYLGAYRKKIEQQEERIGDLTKRVETLESLLYQFLGDQPGFQEALSYHQKKK